MGIPASPLKAACGSIHPAVLQPNPPAALDQRDGLRLLRRRWLATVMRR